MADQTLTGSSLDCKDCISGREKIFLHYFLLVLGTQTHGCGLFLIEINEAGT